MVQTINYISDLPFGLAGNAKYMAAAMLNKEVHEEPTVNGNRVFTNEITKPFTIAEVFPNPASDKVYLILNITDVALLSIYDGNGKKVYEDKTRKNFYEFNCKNLKQGFYNFKVLEEGKEPKSGGFQVIH